MHGLFQIKACGDGPKVVLERSAIIDSMTHETDDDKSRDSLPNRSYQQRVCGIQNTGADDCVLLTMENGALKSTGSLN